MRARGVSYVGAVSFVVFVCVLLVGDAAEVHAGQAEALIEQVLRDTRSAHAAAKELVARAKGLNDSPAVQVRLCEKAYECGMSSPLGYASALAALDILCEIAPGRASMWDARRLNVVRLRYLRCERKDKLAYGRAYVDVLLARAARHGRADRWSDAEKEYGKAYELARTLDLPEGTVIHERLREARLWIAIGEHLSGLKAALAKNPNDAKCRKQLVEMYLIDLDMPIEASRHLTDAIDPTMRKNVSLAAREASDRADADFATLGYWYRVLAGKTQTRLARVRLLVRARDNLTMYLEVHRANDLQRRDVVRTLTAIQAELKALGVRSTVPVPPPTVRVLTLELPKGQTMTFVRIMAGTFTMGSPETEPDREPREGPQRRVTLTTPFYMGVTEVTQGQYAAVMGKNPSKVKGRTNPVERVSWNNAVQFCKVLSRKTGQLVRLPTEAEWEYACRAGTTTAFGFGNDEKDFGAHAWYLDNAGRRTHPVGRKKPNPWGLYDMHGNVWEWCEDGYVNSYANVGVRDPKAPGAGGGGRVRRGGSFIANPKGCRAAHRRGTPRSRSSHYGGFRAVIMFRPPVE